MPIPLEALITLPSWLIYPLVFCLSLGTTLALTPVARLVAIRFDIVDHPGERKIHTRVVPYLGGLAIYSGFLLAVLVSSTQHVQQLGAILLGATFVMMLGLWDDRHGMNPAKKTLGQVITALIAIYSDIRFNVTDIWLLDFAISVLWIVGISNAFNLLDNMDGLSTGTTLISGFFLFLLAAHNGQFLVASMAVSLVGACFGFWWFNRPPASIFMGDAGSLFLGFMLAVLGIKLRPVPGEAIVGFLVPVILLGLPILDTTLVFTQRILNGRPFYLGGKDHCSHRLVNLGMSHKEAVLWLYLVTAFYGFWALIVNAIGLHPVIIAIVVVSTMALYVMFAGVEVYALPGSTTKPLLVQPGAEPRPSAD